MPDPVIPVRFHPRKSPPSKSARRKRRRGDRRRISVALFHVRSVLRPLPRQFLPDSPYDLDGNQVQAPDAPVLRPRRAPAEEVLVLDVHEPARVSPIAAASAGSEGNPTTDASLMDWNTCTFHKSVSVDLQGSARPSPDMPCLKGTPPPILDIELPLLAPGGIELSAAFSSMLIQILSRGRCCSGSNTGATGSPPPIAHNGAHANAAVGAASSDPAARDDKARSDAWRS